MTEPARVDFGSRLRHAREARGLSLQQVAATTKISARMLDALERNDVSKLPGGIFSRAFVRTYAREVGLEPEDTVRRFVEAFPPDVDEPAAASATSAVDAENYESGRRTAVTLLQVLGVSLLVIIAVAAFRSVRSTPVAAPVAPPPPVLEVKEPAPSTASAATAAVPEGQPDGAPPDATVPAASPQPAMPGTAAPLPPAPQAAAPSAQGAGAPVAATPDMPLALSVLASEECWLSLSVDGQKVVARNLQAGERVQFRARSSMVISAGNAGGLALTLNGKPARPLGNHGEVVTTTITVDSLKNFVQ